MKRAQELQRGRRAAPLRRFREAVCFACAFLLWVSAWAVAHTGFAGRRGHTALFALGALETVWLALLFWREQSTEREIEVPWITLAWASLPVWCAAELVVGSVLMTR